MSNRTARLAFSWALIVPALIVCAEAGVTKEMEREMEASVRFGLLMFRPKGRPNAAVKEAVDALRTAKTVDELRALPADWKERLSPKDQRGLIRELAKQMSSRASTPLGDPQGRLIWHPRMTQEEKNAYYQPRKPGERRFVFNHDVMMFGGRCAWALEELLHVRLIPVKPVKQPLLDELVRENTLIVLGEMAIPPVFDFEKMSAAERLELAKTVGGATHAAQALARDDDVAVRRAIAARSDITQEMLLQLQEDPDEEVKRLARKSLSRKLLNDIPP